MGEAQKRKGQGLQPKNTNSKKKPSGFAELKKGLQNQSKQNNNQDEIKEKEAIAYLQAGKLKEAEEIYRDLVAKGSKNHAVYGNLAAILQINGQKEGLIYLFNKAIKLNPWYWKVWTLLILGLFRIKINN